MAGKIIDGKMHAENIRSEVADGVARYREQSGRIPHLVVVLVGEDPASQVYVRNKQKATEKVGMRGTLIVKPATISQHELVALVQGLSDDPDIDGILVQLPLPNGLDENAVLDVLDPKKDVDGLHPENVGLLAMGRPRFVSCTPTGVHQLLIRENIPIEGSHVVIVGRSGLVGRPLSTILSQKGKHCDATVTLCHSRTKNLADEVRRGDIVVAALGKPKFLTAAMIKPGAAVIDVGINRLADGTLAGDVDYEAVREIASAITPVPGGVGPMTIAMLLSNTLLAANMRSDVSGMRIEE